MVSAPVETVFATEDPEIVPKKAEETTDTLAGPAGIASREDRGVVDEQLSEARPLGDDAEQHEVEHDGGDDPERHAEDAFLREVHGGHEGFEIDARVLEEAREIGSEQRVGDEDADDRRQHPSERPARDVQHQYDEDQPKKMS